MMYGAGEIIDDVRSKMIDGKEASGLTTGFRDLDWINGGLKKKDLIVLGARPSMGKTALMLNILEHVGIDTGKTCVLFELEMTAEQCIKRFLTQRAHVESMKEKYNEEQMDKLSEAAADIKRSNIFIDDTTGMSVEYMRKQCLKIKETNDIAFVAVDYLQLIVSENEDSFCARMNKVVRELKQLAVELDCPILVLSQLNRGVEKRPDHRPLISDFRDYNELEEIADEIWLLYRDDYYNWDSEQNGIAEIRVCKCKNGISGCILLGFIPELLRFCNLDGTFKSQRDKDILVKN